MADHMIAHLEPIRERYQELIHHQEELRAILAAGADQARKVARATMEEDARTDRSADVGFRPRAGTETWACSILPSTSGSRHWQAPGSISSSSGSPP